MEVVDKFKMVTHLFQIKDIKREKNIAVRAASGILWMSASSAGIQGISFLINIILARLLVPSDFGAVALTLSITGILQTFAEFGTSVAIVQRKKINNYIIDSAFTTTILLTTAIFFALWFSAPLISNFFKMPVVSDLLRIAAIAYIFRGVYAVYRCLLLRDMKYKTISLISLLGQVIYGFTASYLAYIGFGAYSMVLGQVGWTFCVLLLGILITGYIPKSLGNSEEMRQLISFGFWVSLGRVLRNSAGRMDNFIVGKFLNAKFLGQYNLAQRIILLVPQVYTRIIDQVMLPIYSKWQADLKKIEEGYWKALSFASLLLLPSIFLIGICAEPLVNILFGVKWLDIVPLIKIMCVYALMRIFGDGLFDSVVFATGKPHIVTIVNTFRFIFLPLCVSIGVFWGIKGVAIGLSFYGIVNRFFCQFLLYKYFKFSLFRYFKEILSNLSFAIIATTISFIIIKIFKTKNLMFILSETICWIVTYIFCIRILARKKWDYMKYMCKSIFSFK